MTRLRPNDVLRAVFDEGRVPTTEEVTVLDARSDKIANYPLFIKEERIERVFTPGSLRVLLEVEADHNPWEDPRDEDIELMRHINVRAVAALRLLGRGDDMENVRDLTTLAAVSGNLLSLHTSHEREDSGLGDDPWARYGQRELGWMRRVRGDQSRKRA